MSQPYVGEIRIFAGTYEPVGWLFCNGQTLPISEYETLFVLIGTTYGGDGQETFNLPDLRGRLPMHQNGSTHIPGEMAGVEQVTLTVNQMPVHAHTFIATTGLGDEGTPGGNVPAQSTTTQLYRETDPNQSLAATAVTGTGGSQPHDNMHPYLAVNFIISLFGEYPTQ